MKGIFYIEKPDEVRVQLTVTMTLGEARAVRDYLSKAQMQISEPYAATEFKRQLMTMIGLGEQRFASGPIPTERPDG